MIPSNELYQAYRSYSASMGEFTHHNSDFVNMLEEAGFERRKTKTCNLILGLKLRPNSSASEEFADFLK